MGNALFLQSQPRQHGDTGTDRKYTSAYFFTENISEHRGHAELHGDGRG